MRKIIIIGVILIAAAITASIILFSGEDIETAIDEFEDSNYSESIEILNRLIPLADYESAEKMYYYRCRSINRLATQMEEDLDEELLVLALENKSNSEYDRTEKEVKEDIAAMNTRIKGDLDLIFLRKRSRIIPKGAFYNEFVSRYRGSSMIEDLDFEQIQQLGKTDSKQYFNSLINFYNKYPNTSYIAQIVRTIFDGLQNNTIDFVKEKRDILWEIITSYVRRYPTSPVMSKLYMSNAENVNLRNSPGIQGNRVGKVKDKEILIQLEKSMDSSQVGDVRDYWYRVSSLEGTKGWIFGKFLTPIDAISLKTDEKEERWGLNENFEVWSDSNTPENWSHMKNADKATISFKAQGEKKIVELNSPAGKSSGLYSRYNSSRAFRVLTKARFIQGNTLTLISYSIGSKVFYIKLLDQEIEVSGRKIPIATSDWHEYILESEDGRYATLKIDNEIISSRIQPAQDNNFPHRGVYCLFTTQKESAKAEIEFIKVR